MAENSNEAWEDQQKTYASFLAITKWSVISLSIAMVLLFFIIQP